MMMGLAYQKNEVRGNVVDFIQTFLLQKIVKMECAVIAALKLEIITATSMDFVDLLLGLIEVGVQTKNLAHVCCCSADHNGVVDT